jgi:polar amino acid transport system substrate-binding protein
MKQMRFSIRCMIIIVLAVMMQQTAFAKNLRQQLVTESTIEQVMRRGVLNVGMSTFVPWAMKDKTGRFIGFEIDVASRLAADMGVKVNFVPTKWSGIIPALLTGKFDVIIGGMGIRPDRNLKVNFSVPYNYSGMSLLASRERAAGFDTLQAFNRPDVAIAARIGTTAATAAKKHLPRAQLRLFDDENTILRLQQGVQDTQKNNEPVTMKRNRNYFNLPVFPVENIPLGKTPNIFYQIVFFDELLQQVDLFVPDIINLKFFRMG